MPETLTVTTYTFDELTGSARETVLDWGRKVCSEGYPCETLTDTFQEELAYRGYTIDRDKISWSLSCCQGDGVAFSGRIDLDELAKVDPQVMHLLRKATRLVKRRYAKHPQPPMCEPAGSTDCWDFTVTISHNSRYCHSESMSVDCELNLHDDPDNKLDPYVPEGERQHWLNPFKTYPPKLYGLGDIALEIEEHIHERVSAISRELETIGYDDIEWFSSDEHVIEWLTDSDYRFDENGEHTISL
jgi:hypothetical protein